MSNSQTELKYLNSFKFYWVGWVHMGGGGCQGVEGCPTHACMCTHVHNVYDIIGFPQGFPCGGSHLHEIIMFNMYACVCMHGTLPTHPQPPHPTHP